MAMKRDELIKALIFYYDKSKNDESLYLQEIRLTIKELKELAIHPQEQEREEDETCPKCNYPKYKNNFEDFERCEGCDWTSKDKIETKDGVKEVTDEDIKSWAKSQFLPDVNKYSGHAIAKSYVIDGIIVGAKAMRDGKIIHK